MGENENNNFKSGLFNISPDRKISGTILLDGPESVLHLWSDSSFNVDEAESDTITGILEDQKKVSLIECVNIGESQLYGADGISNHKKFFPHFIVIGPRHFQISEKVISTISLLVDDAETLFYDRQAFGTVFLTPERLDELSRLEFFNEIPFTKNYSPHIAYYTGKHRIFSANTVIGKITASHSPTIGMGGPSGVLMENKIYVNISFNEPVSVTQLYNPVRKVLRFFEVIIGRPQNLLELKILHRQDGNKLPASSSVYLSMFPNRGKQDENRSPDFRDILIDGCRPRKFGDLLRAWLKRDEEWFIARQRFSEGWAQQRSYSGDRIVRAANMFDLIPNEAFPVETELTDELASAVSECKERFNDLEQSQKRNEILGALGRIKRHSLKQKVRYRSSFLTREIGDHLPDIDDVTDAAVDLRNLYVHGEQGKPDKKIQKLSQHHVFLTDTLEFVLCASDLVELGWDVQSWNKKDKGHGHPFCIFLDGYKKNLSKFKN